MHNNILGTRGVYPYARQKYKTVTKANGAHIFVDNEKSFLDMACGSGSFIFGYGDNSFASIMTEQANILPIFPSKAFGVEVVERYATELVAFAPRGTRKALCLSSGSDAVDAALKLSLQYHCEMGHPQRTKFIGRKGAYHGNSLAGLSVGGFWQRRRPYEGYLQQTAKGNCAKEIDCTTVCSREVICPAAATIADAIDSEGAETVAAVVLEPVVGAALSAHAPCDRYLADVRNICERFGVLLVFDEVMTGFGRTGVSFSSHLWSVTPDITVCGKAISGGYFPLSAILVADRVTSVLEAADRHFQIGHTHACNPVGAAIGLEVLRRLSSDAVFDSSRSNGERIRSELAYAVSPLAVTGIRGRGSMIGFDIVPASSAEACLPGAAAERFYRCAIDEGLIIYPSSGGNGGVMGDHAMLLPPLNLQSVIIDELVGKFSRAAKSYLERGRK